MTIRGQLAFDDDGNLVAIDPNASDPSNPDPSEILPVPFDELTANLVDATAVETEDYSVSNISAGTLSDFLTADADTDNLSRDGVEFTSGVGTSATEIYAAGPDVIRTQDATVLVRSGGTDYVIEQVSWGVNAGASATILVSRGSVPGRTYSENGGALELALDSGSANVAVRATGLSVPSP